MKQTAQEEDSEISSSSADSLTDDSVDTASESGESPGIRS